MTGALLADEQAVAVPKSPFKGLTNYTEKDAAFFFGREREREVIIANLEARPLTVLYGRSGVGKSSLLLAGAAARLLSLARESHASVGCPEYLPIVFTSWRDDPVAGLIDAIRAAAAPFMDEPLELPASPRLDEAIEAAADALDAHLLFILDQFEEYFLYHRGETGAGTLATELPRAVNRAGLPAGFLVAIREDALAELDRFKPDIPRLFDTSLRVSHLDREAAREAILRPVEEYNKRAPERSVTVEPELVEAVLDQVRAGRVMLAQAGRGTVGGDGAGGGADEIETPYLQLVLTRLWEKEMAAGSRTLRLSTLNALGGAETIVRTHLDTALEELPDNERAAVADIFHHLVTPSGMKIAHGVIDLAGYTGRPPAEVEKVLTDLGSAGRRIVRPVPLPPGQTGEPRFEIFHDVLAPAILDWRTRQVADRLAAEKKAAQESARSERRRARVFRAALVASLVLLAGAVIAIVVARSQTTRAQRAERNAASGRLAGIAIRELPSDPNTAVPLALGAYELAPTPEARAAVLTALGPPSLAGHSDLVNSVAFSPDGKTLASASRDLEIRLWNVAARKLLGPQLIGHTGSVEAVAFSPDRKTLASGSEDRTVRLWNLATHKPIGAPLRGHEDAVRTVAFSPDGKMLATGSMDDTVRLWDVATHKPIGAPLKRHKNSVASVAFSPDGKTLASGSWDTTIRFWNVATRKPIGTPLKGHTDAVQSIAFSPDGKTLATGSWDHTVRRWNVATHRQIGAAFEGHSNWVNGVAFTRDGKTLVSGSFDGTVRFWSVAAHADAEALIPGAGTGTLAISPTGATLAFDGEDNTVRLWDLRSGLHVDRVITSQRGATALAVSPNGNEIASTTSRGHAIGLWDLGTRRPIGPRFIGHRGVVRTVAFSRDGKTLASAGEDRVIRLWDVATGKQVGQPLKGHIRAVNSVAFSADGKTLASAGNDRKIRLWDVRTHRQIRAPLEGHTRAVLTVAFSPDGKTLGSGGLDTTVRLWSVATHRQLGRPLTGHNDTVEAVEFSPDGKTLASASDDHTIRLWRVGASKPIGGPLPQSDGRVTSVAFSPDGRLLADTAGATLQLWDVRSREELGSGWTFGTPNLSRKANAPKVVFASGGRLVSTTGALKTSGTLIWSPLLTTTRVSAFREALCPTLRHNLTPAEWSAEAPGQPYHKICAK